MENMNRKKLYIAACDMVKPIPKVDLTASPLPKLRPAEMPKTITMSGSFEFKGNPNKLKAMFNLATVKRWTYTLSWFDSFFREKRTFTMMVKSYREAVMKARFYKNEGKRYPHVKKLRMKVKQHKFRCNGKGIINTLR